jgi:Fe-S-cluster containining protein
MTLDEARRVADALDVAWPVFQADYLDHSWPGASTVLVKHRDSRCLFLEPQPQAGVFFCRIHAFKPASCLDWQAGTGKKECRDGLGKYWRLGIDDHGDFTGSADDIARFNSLMASLQPPPESAPPAAAV